MNNTLAYTVSGEISWIFSYRKIYRRNKRYVSFFPLSCSPTYRRIPDINTDITATKLRQNSLTQGSGKVVLWYCYIVLLRGREKTVKDSRKQILIKRGRGECWRFIQLSVMKWGLYWVIDKLLHHLCLIAG